jgi:hypothetical protein
MSTYAATENQQVFFHMLPRICVRAVLVTHEACFVLIEGVTEWAAILPSSPRESTPLVSGVQLLDLDSHWLRVRKVLYCNREFNSLKKIMNDFLFHHPFNFLSSFEHFTYTLIFEICTEVHTHTRHYNNLHKSLSLPLGQSFSEAKDQIMFITEVFTSSTVLMCEIHNIFFPCCLPLFKRKEALIEFMEQL